MMGGGMRPGRHGSGPIGQATAISPSQGRDQAAQATQAKVRQIGTKTFYFKNNRWVDSTVTPEEDVQGHRDRPVQRLLLRSGRLAERRNTTST